MQTNFDNPIIATDTAQRANEILRSCVHCGFCNATCPTYLLTGNELDGPRGRIYLMREYLQGDSERDRVESHLDRCLTCRACETTCPSGVQYAELAEITRAELGADRTGVPGRLRKLLAWAVPNAKRLRRLSRLGRLSRPFLTHRLRDLVPAKVGHSIASVEGFERQVIVLNGCAQQVTTAETNQHLQDLLATRGVGTLVVSDEQCCGSLDLHYGSDAVALDRMRANVDALFPLLADVDAILSTASGCGVTIKDYERHLSADPAYADRAAAVCAKVLDVSEYIGALMDEGVEFGPALERRRVAWHSPCTLTHGQGLTDTVELVLEAAGYTCVEVRDPHLCCGSAGAYSLFNPELSSSLRSKKLSSLQQDAPEVIASANVGCQGHLQNGTTTPVVHWVQLLK